ncbi:hypothetical protein [Actinoplanes subglobosus]|uniref:Band 7 domain-containing protein n=1 Tax=Actinoplanes subglobosus TaxID=1547892 RepID=A0ABV8IGY7_9ACTN
MTDIFNPILASEAAFFPAARDADVARPGVRVVYTDNEGSVVRLDDKLSRWIRRIAGFNWMRHYIDIGDHRLNVELRGRQLPARGEATFFEATLDIGFRVADAAEVVRRNLVLGDTAIINPIIAQMRPIARQFEIEESLLAEETINSKLGAGFSLPEGIRIYHLNVRLAPDEAARAHLTKMRENERAREIDAQRHDDELSRTDRENAIKQRQHAAELDRYKTALEAVDGLNLDPYQLLLAHVAEHPQDTQGTFDLLMRVWEAGIKQEDTRDARSTELLRHLIQIGAVQAADIERFRDELTDHVRRTSTPKRRAGASWDAPPVIPNGVQLGPVNEHPPATGDDDAP